MRAMVKTGIFLVAGLFSTLSIPMAEVIRNPVNIGVSLEEFQLFNPSNPQQPESYAAPLIMVRPTGWIFESATIDERTTFVIGIGATTFSLPHDSGSYPGSGKYQAELFPAVALVQATGSYTLGDLKDPILKVTFGQMPYKYNPDAKNLGEYLFRSTPYPNTVLNSPFDLVNSAQASILGIVVNKNLAGNKWKNDLLFTSATTAPLYDFSLAYVTSYTVNPIFEVGAGVNLYRLIPVQSSLTTWKGDPGNLFPDSSGYYTFKGQMLMARFSVDFKPIFGNQIDMKLYGEGTLLGVINYPKYYTKPMERMPVMLGLDIPTGGLLDKLTAEVEYWKNPYLNSTYHMAYDGSGRPNLDSASYVQAGLSSTANAVKSDDIKWSVSATKSVSKSLSIIAKAANDHMQLMQHMIADFPGKSYGDVMSRKDSWYYVLRVQLAI